MRDIKRRFKVSKDLEFEVEAMDAAEAQECATQFIEAELRGTDNGLGVEFKSQETREVRLI